MGQILIARLIKEARLEKGLSRSALAPTSGMTADQLKRIENGIGSVPAAIDVMRALDLHLAQVGTGASLVDQITANRIRRGWSHSLLANKAGLTRSTVRSVENGSGSLRSLDKILSVLAPYARPRKPAIRALWQHDPQGNERDVRFTPPDFLTEVIGAFGPIDLDPCAHGQSHVNATATISLANGGDGLRDEWTGDLVFMNPPFSAFLKWLKRADQQWSCGNVKRVVSLVPARLESAWIHDHLTDVADIWVLRGRLKFWTTEGQGNQAPFALMVVMMGCSPSEVANFTGRVAGHWFGKGHTSPMNSSLEF